MSACGKFKPPASVPIRGINGRKLRVWGSLAPGIEA
jgi:hypothetical protein